MIYFGNMHKLLQIKINRMLYKPFTYLLTYLLIYQYFSAV